MPPATDTAPRSDEQIDTGLRFRPGAPVVVRLTHRQQRVRVTDQGAAIKLAGHPRGWRQVARRIDDELIVNVSRHGIISLPVVPVGPPEAEIVTRIGRASLAFYQELLDLSR